MATPAAEVDAAGRPVRVSSPDRVIFEATERTAEVSKPPGLLRRSMTRPRSLPPDCALSFSSWLSKSAAVSAWNALTAQNQR